MALAPSLDLRPVANDGHPNDPDNIARVPANIEAEQAVLGCVLYENDAFHLIEGLEAAPLLRAVPPAPLGMDRRAPRQGLRAELVVSAGYFERDAVLPGDGRDLGYLADLVERAPPPPNASTVAQRGHGPGDAPRSPEAWPSTSATPPSRP
jgi:replicative DNA helicase